MERHRVRRKILAVASATFMAVGLGQPGAWAQPASVAAPVVEDAGSAGQTISLDLKGVDILDVLKLLSQKSGMNFIAGRNVTGRVTIFAKDVQVWEAFERIVDANDLAYERHGDLINVMTARDYELLYGEKFQDRKQRVVIPLVYAKAAQVATVLNQLKSALGQVVVDEASNLVILRDVPSRLDEMRQLVRQLDRPTETRIYTLNYAEAEKLQEKLQEMLTPGVGTMSVDVRTNKVVVTDLPEPILQIDRVIRAFDEQDGEVLIDARIVQVELDEAYNLGIDWQRAFGGTDLTVRSNFRVLSDIIGGTGTGGAMKFISGPAGENTLILEALKTFGTVNTLSNPRITVLNNQEAKILVGTKEAFVTTTTTVPATGSVVTSPEIQFVDVGTKLFVTPKIKRNGYVQMNIRPEVSTATVTEFQDNRIPIVTTTEAETHVLVRSGTTLIIGGLIDDKVDKSRSQIPLLGNLPLVGAAFRSRTDTVSKTELVVFLTPQIISASGERLTDFSSEIIVEQFTETLDGDQGPLPLSYRQEVRDAVIRYLQPQLDYLALPSGSVEITFVLGRDGRLRQPPQVASPYGEAFVAAAQAAMNAIEFPPFPDTTVAQRVQFQLAIDYRPEG